MYKPTCAPVKIMYNKVRNSNKGAPMKQSHVLKPIINKRTSYSHSDIRVLASQFDDVKIKLFEFIKALEIHHNNMLHINESRMDIAEKIAVLAADSPMSEYTGSPVTSHSSGTSPSNVNLSEMMTYNEVHRVLSLRQKMYTDRFHDKIFQYAMKWFEVIQYQTTKSLDMSDKLRIKMDRYESKVNKLQSNQTKIIKTKVDGIDSKAYLKLQIKLERNEIKLKSAKSEYERGYDMASSLVEEVTKRCWKDLFPLFVELAQFDSTLATDEQLLLSHLDYISHSLDQIQLEYDIDVTSRMNRLTSYESNFKVEIDDHQSSSISTATKNNNAKPNYSTKNRSKQVSNKKSSGSSTVSELTSHVTDSNSNTKNSYYKERLNFDKTIDYIKEVLLTPNGENASINKSAPLSLKLVMPRGPDTNRSIKV